MMKPLLVVLGVGAVLGLMLPTGEHVPAPVATIPTTAAVVATQPPRDTVLQKRGNGHFYVDALVNGQPVEFVVDTGATTVALTEDDARRIGLPFTPDAYTEVAVGASGPVRGQKFKLGTVAIGGKSVSDIDGMVLEKLPVSLLGQAYLSRIGGVNMSGDTMTLR